MRALRLLVSGRVQGVGFRPFVYRLALDEGLRGSVRNTGSQVLIEIAGPDDRVSRFLGRLRTEQPAVAHIQAIAVTDAVSAGIDIRPAQGFRILASTQAEVACNAGAASVLPIPADVRLCPQCLEEMFTPSDRRYLYPFTACTRCGPRYSVIRALPYDRERTSQQAFPLCPGCLQEYSEPESRRFHAQALACVDCGPRYWLERSSDSESGSGTVNPIGRAVELIQQGGIVAVKGVGGFHLVCNAADPSAVARLRKNKQRPHKPLALMALNTVSLEDIVALTDAEQTALSSDGAPIVLAKRSKNCSLDTALLAPGLDRLGVMTAYAPLHFLMFHAALGNPQGTEWLQQPQPLLLVMTSANDSGQPMLADNEQARLAFRNWADALLLHDRDIEQPCDDTVVNENGCAVVRPGRGLAPVSLSTGGAEHTLSEPTVLGCGGFLKSTTAVLRGSQLTLSPFIGTLQTPAMLERYEASVQRLLALTDSAPEAIACDLHPDFPSSQFAGKMADQLGIPLFRVQHHRAHMAAVMAEHQLQEPALGLVMDGFGLGDHGEAWGGEMFAGPPGRLEHLGGFPSMPLVGGDLAVQEVWRLGAGLLISRGREAEARRRFGAEPMFAPLCRLVQHGEVLQTSSAGRWFDAIAAIAGISRQVTYEGQAAMLLQALAADIPLPAPQGLVVVDGKGGMSFDLLLDHLLRLNDPAAIAASFHVELASGLAEWISHFSRRHSLTSIVLAGGCMDNSLLRGGLVSHLKCRGLATCLPEKIPAGDAGLAAGQAYLASQMLSASMTQPNAPREDTACALPCR